MEKFIIRKDVSITFYNEKKSLYLETDALSVSLRTSLLQASNEFWFPMNEASNNVGLQPITFMSKSLTCAEMQYSNIKRDALGTLHGPGKFHHECFHLQG